MTREIVGLKKEYIFKVSYFKYENKHEIVLFIKKTVIYFRLNHIKIFWMSVFFFFI